MQKKLIALAVAGLMSGGAFAQTSVTLGGKFDACYSFTRDAKNVTKETQQDGCNSTSRVTIGARENIAKGYDIRVDYDIRFGNVHEGKSGLASNDKKAMAFSTPFGTLQWGTANLQSNDYKLSEKPYMVTPKDTELVKFGVSQWRESSLTSNNTSYWSPVLKVGPFQGLVSASYAFGDNQKSGANDGAGVNGGNVMVLGHEGKLFDGIADYGIDVTRVGGLSSEGGSSVLYTSKTSSGVTTTTAQANGSHVFNHFYLNLRPIPGNKNLKLSSQYNIYKGWEGKDGAASCSSTTGGCTASNWGATSYKEKNTNFVVSYNFDGKAELGVGVSHINGVGTTRYSGRSIMAGGSYFLSKSVQMYAGIQKTQMKSGAGTKGWRYDGTAAGNSATRTFEDGRVVKVGILKEF